jgi:hypothetical protein
MSIVAGATPMPTPTDLAGLPGLLAYTQDLGLEPYLDRPKRGIPTLTLALAWLSLAWLGSGRPAHFEQIAEPMLAALLGCARLPCGKTLSRSLRSFPAKAIRTAVETAYQAELPHRAGRVWVALDAHHVPYWGRGQKDRFAKGWSGSHGRTLRGYRLFLAVDTDTGQIITFLLAHGRTRDAQMLALLARRMRRVLGRRLAGVVADCGFTSRAAVAALAVTQIPFILGFARSKPIKARLAALTPQQRRWLRDGGAITLGPCPWHPRLRLMPWLPAPRPTSAGRGSTSPACAAPVPRHWPGSIGNAGASSRSSMRCCTAMISTIWSATASIPTEWRSASACWHAPWPSATRSTRPASGRPASVSRAPSARRRSWGWAPTGCPTMG